MNWFSFGAKKDQPLREAVDKAIENTPIFEAMGGEERGKRYKVRVIQAGTSLNKTHYPATTLKEAVNLFEGVPVLVKEDGVHVAGGGNDFTKFLGVLSNVTFSEGKTPDSGAIDAELTVLVPDSEAGKKLLAACDANAKKAFGLSISARGDTVQRNGLREAVKIKKVDSVDIVMFPAAGGQVLDLIESESQEKQDENLLYDSPPLNSVGKPLVKTKDTSLHESEKLKQIERRLFEADARELIKQSKLPELTQEKLSSQLKDVDDIETLKGLIESERNYLAKITSTGKVNLPSSLLVEAGEQEIEKHEKMWQAFFKGPKKGERQLSLTECYRATTRDYNITGNIGRGSVLTEAIDSLTFGDLVGDALYRQMLVELESPALQQYNVWRALAGNTGTLKDYRAHEFGRVGGYGEIPVVAEKGTYLPLASPTAETAKVKAQKRGGTEDITEEMIINDDVDAVREIPMKLAEAWTVTLSADVFDTLIGNDLAPDGLQLFHASHNNLMTDALTGNNLAKARLKMNTQLGLSVTRRRGYLPKNLFVPYELEQAAFEIFQRLTGNIDYDFPASLKLDVIPVWCLSDPNDWFITADCFNHPVIKVGFLHGKSEPDIIIASDRAIGKAFTNDVIQYKIKGAWGMSVVNHRTAVLSRVP